MVFTFRRRYLQLAALMTLMFLLFLSSSESAVQLGNSALNTMDSLALSVFTANSAKVADLKSPFNQKVSRLLREKRQSDYADRYWVVDTKLTSGQTQLQIPAYFSSPLEKRPAVVPFDPRFTLAFYYHYLSMHAHDLSEQQVPFHWADWVDMSVLDDWLFAKDKSAVTCEMLDNRPYQEQTYPGSDNELQKGAVDPSTFCRKETNEDNVGLGVIISSYFGRMTQNSSRLLGKAHLYSAAPNPSSLVFLAKDGTYTVDVVPEKSDLLHNGLVEQYLEDSSDTYSINTLNEFMRLQRFFPPSSENRVDAYEISLKHEDFVYKPEELLEGLEHEYEAGQIKPAQEVFRNSLKWSVEVKSDPPKYFYESRIFDTVLGDHYDWRFFNGLQIGSQEQANTLHRLVRTWLSFTRKQGIITWMAHGSLLSWYWNGIAFPWDNDIDVQMSVMDLHKLSLKFNQSLIIEDGEDGFGRYFVDCGTFIATRHHSNGLNNIDARFIDIDTGLYIDITGLSVTNDPNPERYDELLPPGYNKKEHQAFDTNNVLQVYNCRNKHFSSLSEVSPLVKTYVEGEIAYIPKSYSEILSYEYSNTGMLEKVFSKRLFMPQLRLWIPIETLTYFSRYRKEWDEYYSTPGPKAMWTLPNDSRPLTKTEMKTLLNSNEKQLYELLRNDELLTQYIQTRDLTAIHESEIMRLLFGKSTEKIVSEAPDFNPLLYEPHLYRLKQESKTFEGEVEKYYRKSMQLKAPEEVEEAQEVAAPKDEKYPLMGGSTAYI